MMKKINKKMLAAATVLMGGFLHASPALAQDNISTMTCYMDNDLIINEVENREEKAVQLHIAVRGKETVVVDFREEIEPIASQTQGTILYNRLSYGTGKAPLGQFDGYSDDTALTRMPLKDREDLMHLRARSGRITPQENLTVYPNTAGLTSFNVVGRACYLLNANKHSAADAKTLQAMVLDNTMHLLLTANALEAYRVATYKDNSYNTGRREENEKSKKFVALSKEAIDTIKLRKAVFTAVTP